MTAPTSPRPAPLRAETIDEVIRDLTDIVEWAKSNDSRLGYFAAMYRKVTVEVKKRIELGEFEDGSRMERLDVIFANRYLDAYEQHRSNVQPTHAWRHAFHASGQWWPIVLQHLLLGMNAHINLDLGIAAVETMGKRELGPLRADFNRINSVLAELTTEVYAELVEIWRVLRYFKARLGRVDSALLHFSMTAARDDAWRFAERLHATPPPLRDEPIARRDRDTLDIARLIRHPGLVLGAVTKAVRVGEIQRVSQTIEILE